MYLFVFCIMVIHTVKHLDNITYMQLLRETWAILAGFAIFMVKLFRRSLRRLTCCILCCCNCVCKPPVSSVENDGSQEGFITPPIEPEISTRPRSRGFVVGLLLIVMLFDVTHSAKAGVQAMPYNQQEEYYQIQLPPLTRITVLRDGKVISDVMSTGDTTYSIDVSNDDADRIIDQLVRLHRTGGEIVTGSSIHIQEETTKGNAIENWTPTSIPLGRGSGDSYTYKTSPTDVAVQLPPIDEAVHRENGENEETVPPKDQLYTAKPDVLAEFHPIIIAPDEVISSSHLPAANEPIKLHPSLPDDQLPPPSNGEVDVISTTPPTTWETEVPTTEVSDSQMTITFQPTLVNVSDFWVHFLKNGHQKIQVLLK